MALVATTVDAIKEETDANIPKPVTDIAKSSHIKTEDIKEEKVQLKTEPSLKDRTPTKVLNPFALKASQNLLKNRIKRCQQELEAKLHSGSNQNTEHVENCRRLLTKISDPQFVVTAKIVESIEEVLGIKETREETSVKTEEINIKTKSESIDF